MNLSTFVPYDEVRGLTRLLTLYLIMNHMIEKAVVEKLVEEWLDGKEYFLVDVTVSADDRIVGNRPCRRCVD